MTVQSFLLHFLLCAIKEENIKFQSLMQKKNSLEFTLKATDEFIFVFY